MKIVKQRNGDFKQVSVMLSLIKIYHSSYIGHRGPQSVLTVVIGKKYLDYSVSLFRGGLTGFEVGGPDGVIIDKVREVVTI